MPIAIQEYAKSLVFKNAYAFDGDTEKLVVYQQFYKSYKEAKAAARDRGRDKYLYTFAQEIIIIPDEQK
jgi:hypothetical protein